MEPPPEWGVNIGVSNNSTPIGALGIRQYKHVVETFHFLLTQRIQPHDRILLYGTHHFDNPKELLMSSSKP